MTGLLTILLLVTVIGDGYVVWLDTNINRKSVFCTQVVVHCQRPPAATDKAMNFLIVGSDSRAGANAGFNVSPGDPQYVQGQRSDTTIFMHLPPGSARITVVSFPRDSWVEIPAYRDAKGREHSRHHARFNEAFAVGGAPLVTQLVETLTGLRVNHYVEVDFTGFQRMVNALGGLTVCLQTDRHDKDSGDFLTAGVHHIDGKQALAFVRDRHSYADQDLGRIRNQQYLMSAVIHKALGADTWLNPLKLTAFLGAATQSLTVDKGLSLTQMRRLALRMRHLDPAHVTFTTVPLVNGSVRRNGQSVVLIDDVRAAALFAGLRADLAGARVSTPATARPTPARSTPSKASPSPSAPTPVGRPSTAASLNCAQ